MALNPIGHNITITAPTVSADTASLIVESITYTVTFEPFDRPEFDNEKLKSAANLCGQRRTLGTTLFGKPFQIVSDCSDLTAVPLGPNSDTNFDNIKQKFRIKRYQIQGALSATEDVNLLYLIAKNHQDQLAKFQHYQARAASDAPYETLIALQAETFDYLTTTGCTLSGTAMEDIETNMLITSMSASVDLVIATDDTDTAFEFYKTFTITIENRELANLDDVA